tara:strand:- start:172 stop:495 length:324 start_codon:yes stop_codon:yes gene_type:complete
MNKEFPEFLQKVIKKYPKVWDAYEKMGESARSENGLDSRTQRLVKLGLAIGGQLEGAVHSHVRKCKAEGISDEEIYHASILAITTLGWPQAMAALSWINDVLGGLEK